MLFINKNKNKINNKIMAYLNDTFNYNKRFILYNKNNIYYYFN